MEANFEKLPIDVGSVPHDPDGWLFYIHLTEAHFQFDFFRTQRWGKAHLLRGVGDCVVRDSSVPWRLEDFSPFVRAQYDPTSKQNLTQWAADADSAQGPVHILYYRVDDAPLEMEMPIFENLRNDGIVNYHGHISVAQDDGRLLGASFFEHMPSITGYTLCVIYLKLID
jgi:hypothetical protein